MRGHEPLRTGMQGSEQGFSEGDLQVVKSGPGEWEGGQVAWRGWPEKVPWGEVGRRLIVWVLIGTGLAKSILSVTLGGLFISPSVSF